MLYNQNWDQNSPVSILNRAADIIEQRGLGKGHLLSCEGGSPCSIGALMLAVGMTEKDILYEGWFNARGNGHYDKLKEVIATITPTLPGDYEVAVNHSTNVAPLIVWNNATDRTTEEVVTKFREVATSLVDV